MSRPMSVSFSSQSLTSTNRQEAASSGRMRSRASDNYLIVPAATSRRSDRRARTQSQPASAHYNNNRSYFSPSPSNPAISTTSINSGRRQRAPASLNDLDASSRTLVETFSENDYSALCCHLKPWGKVICLFDIIRSLATLLLAVMLMQRVFLEGWHLDFWAWLLVFSAGVALLCLVTASLLAWALLRGASPILAAPHCVLAVFMLVYFVVAPVLLLVKGPRSPKSAGVAAGLLIQAVVQCPLVGLLFSLLYYLRVKRLYYIAVQVADWDFSRIGQNSE